MRFSHVQIFVIVFAKTIGPNDAHVLLAIEGALLGRGSVFMDKTVWFIPSLFGPLKNASAADCSVGCPYYAFCTSFAPSSHRPASAGVLQFLQSCWVCPIA